MEASQCEKHFEAIAILEAPKPCPNHTVQIETGSVQATNAASSGGQQINETRSTPLDEATRLVSSLGDLVDEATLHEDLLQKAWTTVHRCYGELERSQPSLGLEPLSPMLEDNIQPRSMQKHEPRIIELGAPVGEIQDRKSVV